MNFVLFHFKSIFIIFTDIFFPFFLLLNLCQYKRSVLIDRSILLSILFTSIPSYRLFWSYSIFWRNATWCILIRDYFRVQPEAKESKIFQLYGRGNVSSSKGKSWSLIWLLLFILTRDSAWKRARWNSPENVISSMVSLEIVFHCLFLRSFRGWH